MEGNWWHIVENSVKFWKHIGKILESDCWNVRKNVVKSGEQFCEKLWEKFGKILRIVW